MNHIKFIPLALYFYQNCFYFEFDSDKDVEKFYIKCWSLDCYCINFVYWLLKCSGLALITYQLTIYQSVEKASGPISIARISAVSFHLIVEIIASDFLLFEVCPVPLIPYADVIHTSFAKLPLHSIVVRLSTIHSAKYCFNSEKYSVCKCTSSFN